MATTPTPEISNLRLCSAFRGLACDVLSCISISNSNYVYIIDDNETKISRFARQDEAQEICFCGINPNQHNLHLLAIDNKLLSNVEGGIADCALFNTNTFAIIEFKTNALGKSQKSVEDTYEKAINQLKNTIRIFSDRLNKVGIDFISHINITPHIVIANRFPRRTATEQNYALKFVNELYIELSFENSCSF